MHSLWEFALIALLVTLTPGPATALVLRTAARDGRRAAFATIAGNSVGVLMWGCLSAVGVSSLIVASQVAYDILRVGGALLLIALGLRSLLGRDGSVESAPRGPVSWRSGIVSGVANPKLAVFFIALLPQFLSRGQSQLPIALGMAVSIVACDVLWFGLLAWAVDRAATLMRPRVRRGIERLTGGVMVGLGIRLAVEAR